MWLQKWRIHILVVNVTTIFLVINVDEKHAFSSNINYIH